MNREFMRRKILIAGVCATYLIAGCSQNKVNNDSDTAQPPINSDMDTPSTLSEEKNLADIETMQWNQDMQKRVLPMVILPIMGLQN